MQEINSSNEPTDAERYGNVSRSRVGRDWIVKCPKCNYPRTTVKDSRPWHDQDLVYRVRLCVKCDTKMTTFEKIEYVHEKEK